MRGVPILGVEQAELAVRFGELVAVLGARRVADFVRRHHLRHLRSALLAQGPPTSRTKQLELNVIAPAELDVVV